MEKSSKAFLGPPRPFPSCHKRRVEGAEEKGGERGEWNGRNRKIGGGKGHSEKRRRPPLPDQKCGDDILLVLSSPPHSSPELISPHARGGGGGRLEVEEEGEQPHMGEHPHHRRGVNFSPLRGGGRFLGW